MYFVTLCLETLWFCGETGRPSHLEADHFTAIPPGQGSVTVDLGVAKVQIQCTFIDKKILQRYLSRK